MRLILDGNMENFKKCKIDGCERKSRIHNCCRMHYQRFKLTGNYGPSGLVQKIKQSNYDCKVDGCNKKAKVSEYCGMHYQRIKNTGNPGNIESNKINKFEFGAEKIDVIIQMHNDNLSIDKIANYFNCNESVISRIFKELNLKPNGHQRTAHLYEEKECAGKFGCHQIKPIDQFRERYNKKTDRTSFEVLCLDCERVYRNEGAKRREKEKRATDPSHKLRRNISWAIWYQLKNNKSGKNNASCLKYLDYDMQALKDHLENQFESWMTWDNYGTYNRAIWNDNDSITWTWNLDHISPQSELPYTTMEDENFKKCWKLSNLRPLSSKQNNLDGVLRKRHKNG